MGGRNAGGRRREPGQTGNSALLDRVFRSAEVKHGLSLFKVADLGKLSLTEERGKIYVACVVTNKKRIAKPEEIVRQLAALWLTDDLGYPVEAMSVEVPIKMGSTYAPKKADLVVYKDSAKRTPYIITEVKKPLRKDGLEQLNSYMNATGVHYGAWLNGKDAEYQLRVEPNLFETLQRLPAIDEDLDDVKTPIKKKDLKPIHDLKDEIQYLEDTVLANAGVSTFEEIFKLIFAKLYDEFNTADDESVDFRTTTAPPEDQYDRINKIFRRAAEEWPDIFTPADKIELTPPSLVAVASAFQTKRFFDADLDVIDAAFEYMINPEQKGDKGQYFTPRAVVKMCERVLNPQPNERVVDPACGPGGFLIHALNWVSEQFLRPRYERELAKRKSDYANSRLFGLDFDHRLVRVAKAMMLIAGDGRSNIYRVNTLDAREWTHRTDALQGAVRDGIFDVVMTNPPFAGDISQPEILGGYDLAYKGDPTTHKRANHMTRDLLFLERCLRLLKPGGRMAIVLPQGNMNNTSLDYVRNWMVGQARLLAVVGLHPNTFKPFTGTKTSVVFLQKWRNDPVKDYPVFFAVNDRPVKDNRGNYIFRKTPDNAWMVDEQGKRVVDHDLDQIADAFVRFARRERLDFWK